MYIQQRVLSTLGAGRVRLFDADGRLIPTQVVVREFLAIREHIRRRVRPGGTVGVRLPFGHHYLLCAYACMESGRVYVPLELSWPDQRIEQIRQGVQLDLLVDPPTLAAMLGEPAGGLPHGETGPIEATAGRLDPESILYIIHTSGSTGSPKGVMIPRRGYENFLRVLDGLYPEVTADDCLLMVARFTFDLSLLDLGMVLLRELGCRFSRHQGDAFRLAWEIEEYRITWMDAVPNLVGLLMSEAVFPRADLSSLRFLAIGGARFPAQLLEDLQAKMPAGVRIDNCYGPTETTVYTHFKRLTRQAELDSYLGTVSVGQPASGVRCLLADPDGRPVTTPYAPGQMLLGGVQLMAGYCNDPQRTAAAMADIDGVRYYRTGDVAFFDRKGDYYIAGRMDETIKRRGYRVNLLDIDSYILRIPGVRDCVTLAYPAAGVEHLLVTVVIPAAGAGLTRPWLLGKMSETLVDYQIPDVIEFADALPVSGSGKVDRGQLMRAYRPPNIQPDRHR